MTEDDWQDIDEIGDIMPYVDWWRDMEAGRIDGKTIGFVNHTLGGASRRLLDQGRAGVFDPRLLQRRLDLQVKDIFESARLTPAQPQVGSAAPARNSALQVIEKGFGGRNPLPAVAINPGFDAFLDMPGSDWVAPVALRPDDIPPDDAVIVGIVDAAIAVGHQRFQFRGGKSSRILAAWQQSAIFAGQAYLPFGRELLKTEIDSLLTKHSANGPLDEEAFNDDAGLVDLTSILGQRELNHRIGHGTHVLDIASGFDIAGPATDDAHLARRPIIAVNMPNRKVIGSAGSFLEMFAIQGIARIVELADRFWAQGEGRDGRGYPIVINLSYGLQAGPKDGTMLIETYVSQLIRQRAAEGKAPLRIVLPAGNENLERGNAYCTIAGSQSFTWRIQPEDQTSNYVEIWSDILDETRNPLPLKISVTPPGGQATPLSVGSANSVLRIGQYARVYCQARRSPSTSPGGTGQLRQRFVICVAPTISHSAEADALARVEAPSGAWTITLGVDRDAYPEGLNVFLNVQSDQSTRPGAPMGRASYLESDRYRSHGPSGAMSDTFAYSRDPLTPAEADQEPEGLTGPVQRKGTLNAIASIHEAVVVAGHAVSDGRPVPYSSTGPGHRLTQARSAPTLSYPAADGPAHQGLLAAGSRSGSAVLMQGTSFATAQATREIADILEGWSAGAPGPANAGSPDDMRQRAAVADANDGTRGRIFEWKSGAGRMTGFTNLRAARREPS